MLAKGKSAALKLGFTVYNDCLYDAGMPPVTRAQALRKKWEACWDEVKCCSQKCKSERKRQKSGLVEGSDRDQTSTESTAKRKTQLQNETPSDELTGVVVGSSLKTVDASEDEDRKGLYRRILVYTKHTHDGRRSEEYLSDASGSSRREADW
eukprot:178561-Prorocentrum_minimum.AAC.8